MMLVKYELGILPLVDLYLRKIYRAASIAVHARVCRSTVLSMKIFWKEVEGVLGSYCTEVLMFKKMKNFLKHI